MPRPVPMPLRQAIWNRSREGQDVAAIADGLGLPIRTVRRLLAGFRSEGRGPLPPAYARCGAATSKLPEAVVQAALALRREHPTWGAGLIRVMLRRLMPNHTLPSTRTIQRWLLRAGLAPAPTGRRPSARASRAARPHEVWQMDAAELVPLKTGRRVCWFRLADECTGAVLWTEVFPPGLLESGPPDGDPGAAPPGLRPLGAARAAPRG